MVLLEAVRRKEACCGGQGTSGVHPGVSYVGRDLGMLRMLPFAAGNIAHSSQSVFLYFG